MFMFCRNCIDEGMVYVNCFLYVNFLVIIILCIFFFGIFVFILDIRKIIMLIFGSLIFGIFI